MKAFTWKSGRLTEGIVLQKDERLGMVIFLGEEGRGRRYEKVALGRRNPAHVIDGRVLEAHPAKIVLPARDGKLEKSFYVLEAPKAEVFSVLVRVNTSWCYTKNTQGGWKTMEGSPETLVAGYGAHGDAGRIGNWADGLVVMKSEDVLRIKPEGGHKTETFVLWLEGGCPRTATLQDYENLQAVAKAEAIIAEAEAAPEALPVVFGQMPAFTFAKGQVARGIAIGKTLSGLAVVLGESGRGRQETVVPLIGFSAERLESSAVVELEKGYGLIQSDRAETGAALVRVDTKWCYTKGSEGKWEAWKGNPVSLASGHAAQGMAGRVSSMTDELVVLHEGDVLFVSPEGGYKTDNYALFIEGGEVRCELWIDWRLKDGLRDPEFYVAKGTAPWGHVPADWVGRIVKIRQKSEATRFGSEKYDVLEDGEEGEVVLTNPLTLNLGWDGRDRQEVVVRQPYRGAWVVLQADKQVKVLEGEELVKREELKAKARDLRAKAKEVAEGGFFAVLTEYLQGELLEITEKTGFDSMPTSSQDSWDDSIESWISKAERVFSKLSEVQEEAGPGLLPEKKVLQPETAGD